MSQAAHNSISVVIPSFNRRPMLRRALESVFEQSSPVDEVIVVDDGSDDGSAQHIEKYFPQVVLIRQKNLGVSAARNRGIKAAGSDWIALLDSDDQWQVDKIKTVREAQAKHPQYALFHSDEIWIRNGVRVNAMNKHQKSGGWIFQKCLPLCVISPSAVVIRKDVFNQVGYFDENLPACEDYDMWLRICHHMPVFYVDRALIVKHGGHADQLSRKHWGMDRFRVQSLHKVLEKEKLRTEDRLAAEAMLFKKLDILLKGARKHGNQSIIDEYSTLAAKTPAPC